MNKVVILQLIVILIPTYFPLIINIYLNLILFLNFKTKKCHVGIPSFIQMRITLFRINYGGDKYIDFIMVCE